MQKPLQISENTAKWIMRVLVGGFVVAAVAMTGFILFTWRTGNTAKIKNLEVAGAVTSIRQPDSHNTKWYEATLSDGKSIVLEDEMRGVLKVGDSLFKKKGEGYYRMKQGDGKETRIRVFQP